MNKFPQIRYRRTRQTPIIRDLISENYILPQQLILPLFLMEGHNIKEEITSLPNVFRYSIDKAIEAIEEGLTLGVKTFALFPCVEKHLKNGEAEEAYNPENLLCRSIEILKRRYGAEILLITDVALDPYTDHGHDGIYREGRIINDETVEILCKQAIVQAAAGADIVAPSDMMDGRIINIRNALDITGLQNTIILSYAAKYASSLYAPFRDAIGSSQLEIKIDKASYQMDFRNSKEALREITADIAEGADIIMVKPATFYLDIIRQAKDNFNIPIFAYQVSGEYQLFKTYGGIELLLESLVSIKRAGATAIFCYGALEIARVLTSSNNRII